MSERNCLIIHGCPSSEEKAMNPETRTFDKHWQPWLQRELIARGIPTERPMMPNPWAPNYEAYRKELEKYSIHEGTTLVGHSCGSAFLVRWLGETKQKIDKLILVAPWKIPDSDDEAKKAFYLYPIDATLRSRVNRVVIFTSDNEEEDGKTSAKIFQESLGGQLIELKGRGHYCLDDMGTEEFPELLEIIAGPDSAPPTKL